MRFRSCRALEGGLLAEDEGERRGLLGEEVLACGAPAARRRRQRTRTAVEEPEDLGVPIQLQVLQ